MRSLATRLVGRDEELELLCRRWQQARLGEGRVVLISGEPGIGNIWHFGITAVLARLQAQTVPIEAFTAKIAAEQIPRVRGTAVFLTRTQRGAPPVMVWHVRRNRALHEHLFVLTIVTESVPWVGNSERLTVEEQAPCFWRAAAHFGFMERPDIPAVLRVAHQCG